MSISVVTVGEMKITKRQLRRIIRESILRNNPLLTEGWVGESGVMVDATHEEFETLVNLANSVKGEFGQGLGEMILKMVTKQKFDGKRLFIMDDTKSHDSSKRFSSSIAFIKTIASTPGLEELADRLEILVTDDALDRLEKTRGIK